MSDRGILSTPAEDPGRVEIDGEQVAEQHPLMAPPAARRAARPARSRVSRMTKAYRFLAFYLILALACASWKLQVGWNTFKDQMKAAWRNQP